MGDTEYETQSSGWGEGLFVTDSAGVILEVTDAVLGMTGYSNTELLGMSLSDLFGTQNQDDVGPPLGATLAEMNGSSRAILGRADGTEAIVELCTHTVTPDSQEYRCVSIRSSTDSEPAATPSERESSAMAAYDALCQLHKQTMESDSVADTTERLLKLGCDYLGLETGVLARVDDSTYEVAFTAGDSDVAEPGTAVPLCDTVAEAVVAGATVGPPAFFEAEVTADSGHPLADGSDVYVGAPVIVEGDVYGTVEFTGSASHAGTFGQYEREFVEFVARWLGTEIDQERRIERLERYETVLEAVDDPVYALDTDARFTFVNDAAKREFGYGEEILGEHVSIGMKDEDIQRVAAQRRALVETDEKSKTAQFELETADGDLRLVENRLVVIGKSGFEGTAGVLRDVTDREQRRRQLESFQQAIAEAADGVAILEGDEYVYVDPTHADMYGFDSTDQLLGNTWRMLYDEDEVERLEAEAFPALESEGHWRGKVTGSRPDGTTFPAALSLTIVDDGRLVCTVRDETERLARKRELKLKERAMDEADVGIQITDPTQTGNPLIYVNDGFERMTGYAREEILGWNPRFLQGGETDPEQVAQLREAVEAGESASLEIRNYRKDGTPYWSRLSITPVRDVDGTVTNYIGIQQDVTERKRQQRELQDRQQKLDLVLSNTDTVIAELDLGSGRVDHDSSLGDRVGELPQTLEAFFDMAHPADRERLESELEAMTLDGDPLDTEYRVVTEDGETVWLSAQAVPITDGGDSPAEIVTIATDITGLKQRQEALEESQNRYRTLLEAAPDPVFVADAETGKIIEVNAAAEEKTGRPREDLLGTAQTDLHPEENRESYRAAFENGLDGRELTVELPDGTQPKLCRADGDPVPVEINAKQIEIPEGRAIYGVFRDVSKRTERTRELELKERAMNEANVGITISDPKQRGNPLVYVNDGFVAQTGYSRTDALGRNCRFLQAGDRDQPALDHLREGIAAAEPVTVELRNYREDGEQFWNRLSVTPVYDDAGALTHYIGIQQDVTEERIREQRLEALYEAMQRLFRVQTRSDALEVGTETLEGALGFDVTGFYEPVDGELVRTAGTKAEAVNPPERVEPGPSPLWEALEREIPVVYDDVETISDGVDRPELVSAGYFPVGEHGVVAIGTADTGRLDDTECRLIEALTANLASVLNTIERQRELVKERERFRLLTESVEEYAFLVVDEDGVIELWNDSAENLFGYDATAAIGMSMAEFHTEANRKTGQPERLLQQARIAGESGHEGWRVRADGSKFYADVRYAPLEVDDGEFRGYAKIVRDLTERRRQQRRTERFVEQADDVVTVLDTEGTITYASGSAERVLGYDPDDIVGENLFEYLHPDSREYAMQMFYDCVDGAGTVQAECRLLAPDGGWFNVEGRCRNMLDDDAVDGILVYLRDVTDIKQRARRFESIFDQTYQFTGLLEPDGTVIEANEAALDFGGFDRADIVGNSFANVPWWTHSEGANDRVRDAIQRAAGGEFIRYETEVRGSRGVGVIDFSVKPVTDEDGDINMLVVEGRDITEQNRRREHLQVMQRVMRHNIRNDLTKLRGFTEAVYDPPDEESQTKYFDRIQTILDKWTDLTEKIRQIRQVLEEQQHSQATVGAAEIAENAARAEEMAAEMTLRNDLSEHMVPQLPALLTEAVSELVENAAEITPTPDGRVTVTLSQADDNWVDITVADNGPGLPEEEANVLRTGEETSLNHGQGLGLWMVRMVTKQAGGNVSVDVTDDGTAVTLHVPTSYHLLAET